jgi:TetR/AcrR family transcriptional regulator, cholesterol catabolism regulator
LAEAGAIVPSGSGPGAGVDGRSSARRGPGTREAIDRAALELFAQRGYHATSMRAIASAAEVQPAAIYHWYAGKEAILVGFQDGFMEQLTAKVLEAVGRQRRPALRLAAAVWEHVVFHGIHRRAAFVTDSEIRALTDEPRLALIAKRDSYQEMFGAMIREGMEDDSLRVSDADVATYAILLQCTGVALWFDPAGQLGLERVADVHVDLVLGSVGAGASLIAEAIGSVSREVDPEERE